MGINSFQTLAQWMVLFPLLSAAVSGFGGGYLPRTWVDKLAVAAVGLSFSLACMLLWQVTGPEFQQTWTWYEWARIGSGLFHFHVGFWCDPLSLLMCTVVTGVSLMVHIYTIGYMKEDPGYARFFSYIALFTFAMLMLVVADNCLQLFFGWEAVGLVSYLLIGFWYEKPSAVYANLKAFLVNRVGDFGFILGIASVFALCHSLDYQVLFDTLRAHAESGSSETLWLNGTAILLFVGAMGKSAQVPLHVWLPDSMEGPTPISALIHAATMVTAGIFMVARFHILFDMAETARTVMLVTGALTAFFMGWVALVQYDIKRIVAYSTLSQLGYMVVALGVSAYSVAIFHLVTHAFFKALLFLTAGSVILGMHHEQDIRNMGGLYRRMPWTAACAWLGTLALVGFPFFSGFYSKDLIIEAVAHSPNQPQLIRWVYFAVLSGVFVTAWYSFRLLFAVFHGKEAAHSHGAHPVEESPKVVLIPLCILAFFSIFSGIGGFSLIGLGDWLGLSHGEGMHALRKYVGSNPWHFGLHGFTTWPFVLLIAGGIWAWCLEYTRFAQWIESYLKPVLQPVQGLLREKYYADAVHEKILVPACQYTGAFLSKTVDARWIDGGMVHGISGWVSKLGTVVKRGHSGYVYHAAAYMAVAIGAIVGLFLWQHAV